MLRAALLVLFASCLACNSAHAPLDAGRIGDVGPSDGSADGGASDAVALDVADHDGAISDGAAPDAPAHDAAAHDALPLDAASLDAAALDAMPDAGVDAAVDAGYATRFAMAENPISEGGVWTNGGSVGIDWQNIQTTNGRAFASNFSA